MSSEAEIRKRKIYRVTFVGFVVNLVLSVLKLAAGIVGRSGAMVADAVHSFSDLATDVVVIAFARISAKPRDDGHDYGHGKYETLATIIISLALGIVGAGILAGSIRDIRIVVDGGLLPRPGLVALVTADPEVCQPHNLRTRRIGAAIAVEVHVRMDGAMTVARSHALTVDIERRLRARFGEGTMIAIHVEPLK